MAGLKKNIASLKKQSHPVVKDRATFKNPFLTCQPSFHFSHGIRADPPEDNLPQGTGTTRTLQYCVPYLQLATEGLRRAMGLQLQEAKCL